MLVSSPLQRSSSFMGHFSALCGGGLTNSSHLMFRIGQSTFFRTTATRSYVSSVVVEACPGRNRASSFVLLQFQRISKILRSRVECIRCVFYRRFSQLFPFEYLRLWHFRVCFNWRVVLLLQLACVRMSTRRYALLAQADLMCSVLRRDHAANIPSLS